jgi:phosphatidylglycerol:prolipoprotein diacylglycerol transferase
MLSYPEIDPVAVALGPLKIHWYGLTYLAGLAFAWWLAVRRSAQKPWSPLQRRQVDDLIFYAAIGVMLGGRLGYALFYGGERLAEDPELAAAGLGGRYGFPRRHAGGDRRHLGLCAQSAVGFGPCSTSSHPWRPWVWPWAVSATLSARSSGAGPASVPWAMVFPRDPLQLPRHPVAAVPVCPRGHAAVRAAAAGSAAGRGPPGRCPACLRSAMACCALSPSSFASRMRTWVSRPLAG